MTNATEQRNINRKNKAMSALQLDAEMQLIASAAQCITFQDADGMDSETFMDCFNTIKESMKLNQFAANSKLIGSKATRDAMADKLREIAGHLDNI
mgnify:CR=1 FL=1|tara:strand:- start:209 stop:496 length:288 start_codon:yes stop_codon:yes gene_type:complete